MNILVTGAKGFVGKNLCAQLKNIRDGKARCYGDLVIDEVFEYDIDSTLEELDEYCQKADFVFNLAGVNRPKDQSEFMAGNFGFATTLLNTLKKYKNTCPVMLSSSQQASLTGRFGNSEYGRSKKAGEDLFLDYERDFLLNQELENSRINATDSDDSESNNKQFSNSQILDNKPSESSKIISNSPILDNKPSESSKIISNSQILDNKGLRPRVLIYRFPNLFGKWCRPNYNSAVATFCNAFANDLPYTVNDPSVELELLYIDDLVDEMIACLKGQEHRCDFDGLEVIPYNSNKDQELENLRINSTNEDDSESTNKEFSNSQILDKKRGRYCYVPTTHKATLGHIVELLKSFAEQPQTLMIPEIPANSFAKKLYSTYLSYLPYEKVAFPLRMNVDNRGSFTELVHTRNSGQVSINISKPGITKGQHWHNTKFEQFIVVKGHGLIQQRNLNDPEGKVLEWEVDGDHIQAVHMLPGYTHNIINLSDTEDLVTVMYCNEVFNPNRPDTFFDPVE